MKLINKVFFLVGILIAAAAINLFLLFEVQKTGTSESYSMLRAGDLKVKTETVFGLANSIASGNEEDAEQFKNETEEVEKILEILSSGGFLYGQSVVSVPPDIKNDYDNVVSSWNDYKDRADKVQLTSVFNSEVVEALNYLLENNGELILTADSISREFLGLDSKFKRHQEIANDLHELAKNIGQHAFLISIGEGEGSQERLKNDRLSFEISLRKLSQVSTDDLDLESVGLESENLIPLPQENSESLRKLDFLWEGIQFRIITLENQSLLSPEFESARVNLGNQRTFLLSSIDDLLESWNEKLNNQRTQQQTIVQILLGVDIVVFFIVFFVIRQSLNPLGVITNGLSRIKEGVYGEKIKYYSKDEVGDLVNTFNVMSDTIKEKEERAKNTEKAKDEFLTMITHELKTPLVPIRGYADILLSGHLGALSDKQKERLKIIKTSSANLLEIISDLLDVQKLELGQLRIKKYNESIKKTIENSVKALQPKADENNVKIKNSVADTIVSHDPERIGQVLTNLIKNSLSFVKPKTGTIEIQTEENLEAVKITVKDNGAGIPLEKQKDLFKKFYQADASLTRERGGSGLGLAICKGIVEGHGGTIEVQSTPNKGTAFSFKIPKNNSK